jgi:hypothetical protein
MNIPYTRVGGFIFLKMKQSSTDENVKTEKENEKYQRNLYLAHLQFIMKYFLLRQIVDLRPQAWRGVSLIYCRQLIVCWKGERNSQTLPRLIIFVNNNNRLDSISSQVVQHA